MMCQNVYMLSKIGVEVPKIHGINRTVSGVFPVFYPGGFFQGITVFNDWFPRGPSMIWSPTINYKSNIVRADKVIKSIEMEIVTCHIRI